MTTLATPEELVTPALISSLKDGSKKATELDSMVFGRPEVAKYLREKMVEDAPAPVEDPAPAPEEKIEVEVPVPEFEPTDDTAERLAALNTRKKEWDDEIARLDAILDKPLPEDDLSEEYRLARLARDNALIAQNRIIRQQNSELLTGNIAGLEKSAASRAESEFYRTAGTIQEKYPVLKTKLPFKQAEAHAKTYYNEILKAHNGGKLEGITPEISNAAWERYTTDAAFRATLPAAPEDFEATTVLMEARSMTAQSGGTIRGNVAEIMERRGLDKKQESFWREQGASDAATRNHDALSRRASEPVPAKLGGGKVDNGPSLDGPVTMTSTREHCGFVLSKINAKMASTPRDVTEADRAQTKICRERIAQLNAEKK